MEPNPDDRLSIEEVTVFLRQLMIYIDLRKEFWKFKVEVKCKACNFN